MSIMNAGLGHSPRSPRRGCRRPLAAGRGRRGLRTRRKPSGFAVRNPAKSCNGNWPRWPGHGGSRSCPTDNCCPCGARVPQGWLPQGPWTALARWMGLESPPGCLPGGATRRCRWPWSDRTAWKRLRSCSRRSSLWAAYADRSPAGPTRPLAICRRRRRPRGDAIGPASALPPLPGQRWVEQRRHRRARRLDLDARRRSRARAAGLWACRAATWRFGMRMAAGSGLRPRVRPRDAGRGEGDGKELRT